MVFFFTGTGNSLYVAKQLEEEQISIPQVMRGSGLSFSADRIGIVCPAGCIHLENQHAVNTGENCQACYACVQACPEMTIQFGDIPMKEPNPNARYRNPNVTLTELVTANNQTEK